MDMDINSLTTQSQMYYTQQQPKQQPQLTQPIITNSSNNITTTAAATVDDQTFSSDLKINSTKNNNDAYISELFNNLTNESSYYESYISSLINSNNIIRWKCNLHYSSKQKCDLALLNNTFLVHIILNVKEINLKTKNFARICNKSDRDEFWERLTYTYEMNKPFVYITMCISSLKNCDLKRERVVMENVFALFDKLDENNYKYSHDNTARDFVESHIVVNNFAGIQLCNTHLLMKSSSSSSNSTSSTTTSNAAVASSKKNNQKLNKTNDDADPYNASSTTNSFIIDYPLGYLQQQQNKKAFYSKASWKKNILTELFPQACNRKKNSIPTSTPDWVRTLFDSLSVPRKKRKVIPNVYY